MFYVMVALQFSCSQTPQTSETQEQHHVDGCGSGTLKIQLNESTNRPTPADINNPLRENGALAEAFLHNPRYVPQGYPMAERVFRRLVDLIKVYDFDTFRAELFRLLATYLDTLEPEDEIVILKFVESKEVFRRNPIRAAKSNDWVHYLWRTHPELSKRKSLNTVVSIYNVFGKEDDWVVHDDRVTTVRKILKDRNNDLSHVKFVYVDDWLITGEQITAALDEEFYEAIPRKQWKNIRLDILIPFYSGYGRDRLLDALQEPRSVPKGPIRFLASPEGALVKTLEDLIPPGDAIWSDMANLFGTHKGYLEDKTVVGLEHKIPDTTSQIGVEDLEAPENADSVPLFEAILGHKSVIPYKSMFANAPVAIE